MSVLQARGSVLGAALVLALVAIGCGGTTTPSTTPSQAAPSTAAGNLPPELADAVQQPDGTYKTADGRVFSAPDQFFSEECADARWPVAEDTVDLAAAAGVPVDPVEWLSHHVHTYLGLFVDGEPEIVPAGIGIDNDGHRIAGLHTHDCSGTVHLEAEEPTELTLGQFADSWGVKLDAQCFADLCAPDRRRHGAGQRRGRRRPPRRGDRRLRRDHRRGRRSTRRDPAGRRRWLLRPARLP